MSIFTCWGIDFDVMDWAGVVLLMCGGTGTGLRHLSPDADLHPPLGEMEMHALPQSVVLEAIRRSGCDLAEILQDGRLLKGGISAGLVVTRPAA